MLRKEFASQPRVIRYTFALSKELKVRQSPFNEMKRGKGPQGVWWTQEGAPQRLSFKRLPDLESLEARSPKSSRQAKIFLSSLPSASSSCQLRWVWISLGEVGLTHKRKRQNKSTRIPTHPSTGNQPAASKLEEKRSRTFKCNVVFWQEKLISDKRLFYYLKVDIKIIGLL